MRLAALLLALVAVYAFATGGGTGDLEVQLMRPNAQRALNRYIEQHCIVDPEWNDMRLKCHAFGTVE